MPLQQLRYVVKVSETGSFSEAARQLFISQPTLSQQIAALEEELGIRLFLRQSRSLCLTEAGKVYVQTAAKILNDLAALDDVMKLYSDTRRGKLRIGFLWIFGYLGLSELISGFAEQYPNIELQIRVDGSVRLLEMLTQRELDAVVMIGSAEMTKRPDLYCRHIMDDYYVTAISRDNPLSESKSITPPDLREEKIIMPARTSAFWQQITLQLDLYNVHPYVVCESSFTDVNIQLVSENLGIAFMSSTLAESLQNGRYRCVPFYPQMKRSLYYVVLKDMLDYPTIGALNQYLDDSLLFERICGGTAAPAGGKQHG